MRRKIPLLLTLLLLVCAQGAGIGHAIGHAFAGRATASASGPAAARATDAGAPGESAPGDTGGSCDKCFQFAHVAGAAAAHVPQLLLDATTDALARGPQAALVDRDTPALRSRGPPASL